jgi:hypothetical protein
MIARLLLRFHIYMLRSEIAHMRADLDGIAKQRDNDKAAEVEIRQELVNAQRAMVFLMSKAK